MSEKPISLTTFLDFVSATSASKVGIVRKFLMSEYDVRADFYKRLRETIRDIHRYALPVEFLDNVVDGARHEVKRAHFPLAVEGYKHFFEMVCAKGDPEWFEPTPQIWERGEVRVRVNPELGLALDGVPHLIKLHFKEEKLLRNRVQVVTHLMREACSDSAPENCVMAVLDIRRGKLVVPEPKADVAVQLDGEVAFWSAVAASLGTGN